MVVLLLAIAVGLDETRIRRARITCGKNKPRLFRCMRKRTTSYNQNGLMRERELRERCNRKMMDSNTTREWLHSLPKDPSQDKPKRSHARLVLVGMRGQGAVPPRFSCATRVPCQEFRFCSQTEVGCWILDFLPSSKTISETNGGNGVVPPCSFLVYFKPLCPPALLL